MSYLRPPRMHFAGIFRADVSTVNNFVTHFRDPNDPNEPGWNAGGTGSWGMINCTVRSAVYSDGTMARTSDEDAAIGLSLTPVGNARLVDLDPEQQLVSEIWGLQLQLERPGGGPAMKGTFKTIAFSDLWPNRLAASGGGDFAMSAFYQTVLAAVAWGDLLGSRLLIELNQTSAAGLVSIKFNVDGFDQRKRVGRVVGTIGPASLDEPEHFVLGRHCMGGAGPVGYFPAVVDHQRGKLIADFGNALQTTSFGGSFDSTLQLQIGTVAGNQFLSVGRVPIGPEGWYEQTAGICEFPADRSFSSAELAQIGATPIGVVQTTTAGQLLVAMEGVDGLHVRADNFVYRLSATESASVLLRASRFGQPLANAEIAISFDHRGLQKGSTDPDIGVPPHGLTFPGTISTNALGAAHLPLVAHPIGTPRAYIDGQVYGVRYSLVASDQTAGYFNEADFVSVLVWSDFPIPAVPTWWQHVQPILKEYEQLYPVMQGIVKLGDYDSVVANRARMATVFSLPEDDPRYMPVTRDLSPAKRKMILTWLATTGNGGKPNLGLPPAAPIAGHIAAGATAARDATSDMSKVGGKTFALRRSAQITRVRRRFTSRIL